MIDVSAPRDAGERRAVIAVLAEAFLDDPVWVAIGPRYSRRHRALANRASFWAIVTATNRQRARLRVARLAGKVVGATIAFDPGRWPLPDTAALWELGWLAVAGPLPALRGIRDDQAMRAQHVSHPHLYLWFIGVAPAKRGAGLGRVLMAELHGHSDSLGLPVYLETGTESNVGFYESLGYELVGEMTMPSGPRMWRMERPSNSRLPQSRDD